MNHCKIISILRELNDKLKINQIIFFKKKSIEMIVFD